MSGIIEIIVFIILVLAITRPLGAYMHRVFTGERTWLHNLLTPVERLVYRGCGIDSAGEMRWQTYAATMLLFNFAGMLLLYAILRLQGYLPLNPEHLGPLSPALAFNTAVSFVTNTNWQAYAGEKTVSYFSQMVGLTYQNFVSAGTGIALAVALVRGLTQRSKQEIGNFWVDLTRATLYVLLPLSVILSLIFVSQGVTQNLGPHLVVDTLEGASQSIAQGPVASQEAIKELGTNGGGFFNANSAHPFENPSPLTNFLQMLTIFSIPAGLTYLFGRYAGNQKQGWALFGAMGFLFLAGLSVVTVSEQAGNPVLPSLGVDQTADAMQPGGNMEGKETRFGITSSALYANVTTAASSGAVNSIHDSYTPLAGGMLMLNVALGELIFGGAGAGLLSILVFAILTVFIAGLMVGRTPEFLGKKIESKEMKLVVLAILIVAFGTLGSTALAVSLPAGHQGPLNLGPHGLSEVMYAATSATGNNGSAFAGLSANTPFYNTLLGTAMLLGRFFFIIPVMAIAGSMSSKKVTPPSSGTFPTASWLFVVLLVAVILIVGALTFFPAYALGPIVEHLLMQAGKLF